MHPGGADTAHAEFVICDQSIEQDHRGVKRVTRPMLGFKSFDAAQDTLAGIELMHMIKKRQMVVEAGEEGSALHVMLALRCSSRQVVVTDEQLDGTDMIGEFLGKRQRLTYQA